MFDSSSKTTHIWGKPCHTQPSNFVMYFSVLYPVSSGAITAKVFCIHPLCLILECNSWDEMKRGSIETSLIKTQQKAQCFYKYRLTLQYVCCVLHPPFVANGSKHKPTFLLPIILKDIFNISGNKKKTPNLFPRQASCC